MKDYNPYNGKPLTQEEQKLDSEIVNWFPITGLQAKAAKEFATDHHNCQRGVIGGAVSYTFTGTSVGLVFKATCACGAQSDFTDYWSW